MGSTLYQLVLLVLIVVSAQAADFAISGFSFVPDPPNSTADANQQLVYNDRDRTLLSMFSQKFCKSGNVYASCGKKTLICNDTINPLELDVTYNTKTGQFMVATATWGPQEKQFNERRMDFDVFQINAEGGMIKAIPLLSVEGDPGVKTSPTIGYSNITDEYMAFVMVQSPLGPVFSAKSYFVAGNGFSVGGPSNVLPADFYTTPSMVFNPADGTYMSAYTRNPEIITLGLQHNGVPKSNPVRVNVYPRAPGNIKVTNDLRQGDYCLVFDDAKFSSDNSTIQFDVVGTFAHFDGVFDRTDIFNIATDPLLDEFSPEISYDPVNNIFRVLYSVSQPNDFKKNLVYRQMKRLADGTLADVSNATTQTVLATQIRNTRDFTPQIVKFPNTGNPTVVAYLDHDPFRREEKITLTFPDTPDAAKVVVDNNIKNDLTFKVVGDRDGNLMVFWIELNLDGAGFGFENSADGLKIPVNFLLGIFFVLFFWH